MEEDEAQLMEEKKKPSCTTIMPKATLFRLCQGKDNRNQRHSIFP
jgi:hypothetical protein